MLDTSQLWIGTVIIVLIFVAGALFGKALR